MGYSYACWINADEAPAGKYQNEPPKVARKVIRQLTNRRLSHDAAVRLRDMLTAHAFLSACQLRAKVDAVGESDLPASWKREDVKLVFKVFPPYFGYFCQII